MSGIEGTRRRDPSNLHPTDDPPRASEPKRPEVAPWNANYDKIPSGIQQYDRALFDRPPVAFVPVAAPALRTSGSAAADAAWNAARHAPFPTLGPSTAPSCSPHVATPQNARSFADRGVPLGLALAQSAIASVADLERFIDDYVAYTAADPAKKQLHDDAVRVGPEVFLKRLDTELAEQQRAVEESRMNDRVAPLQVRPPLPIQQRAAVGEVAIPIARAVTDVAKLVPIVGEMVMAAEALTGRDLAGLGQDLERSERLVTAALLVAPFAAEALATGVRGAAQLARFARATGKSTDETRRVLSAVRTLKDNKVALREGLAAAKAGRALTTEQANAFRAADSAIAELRGAAAQSIFDVRSTAGLPLRTFAPNASGATRTLDEASAIARRHGVTVPSWIRIEVDPTIREAASFAEYRLGTGESGPTDMMRWTGLAPDGSVVVRVHPTVLQSDEKIVGVLQHEVWELSQLRAQVEARQMLPAGTIRDLIDPARASNLHGQAWDIADLRVLVMRETNPAKKAAFVERLTRLAERYAKENVQ